jgi:hypothetical protein
MRIFNNLKFLLLLLVAFTFTKGLNAQSISTTESTCQANGSVVVTGGNPTSLYALTGPGIPIQLGPFSGPSVTFPSLQPGSFTLTEFKDDNSEVTTSGINVPGNYSQNWIFNGTLNYTPCSGGVPTVSFGNLVILNTSPSEQRPPFNFRISAKNGTLPSDGTEPPAYSTPQSGNFPISYPSGMGGAYEIQAKDACGNYKTINIQVPLTAPGPGMTSTFKGFQNCAGDANYEVTPSGGVGPYMFEVTAGPNQVGSTSTGSTANYLFSAGGTYTVKATDQCGGSSTTDIVVKPYTSPSVGVWGSEGDCSSGSPGTGSITIGLDPASVGIGPVTASLVGGAGCSSPAPQTYDLNIQYPSVYFGSLVRPCMYTYTVTDGCGKTITQDFELVVPGPNAMSIYDELWCPDGASTNYRRYLAVNAYYPYVPDFPLSIAVTDQATGLPIAGSPFTPTSWNSTAIELPEGTYDIVFTDQCGATGTKTIVQPKYVDPTVTVDQSNRCFGQGQANVIGVNNRGTSGGNIFNYSISSGPSRVGQGPEVDSPPNTGQFSGLESGGTYQFSFNDGCKTVYATTTIPGYSQPTWDVSFGAICPPVPTAPLQVYNLSSNAVGPYTWRITGTDSDLYGSTPPYNGTLPYPNSLGQTDSLFAGLVPKSDGSTATYQIQGSDACKNSFLGSGKVGPLPEEGLILNRTDVCTGVSTLRARVTIPVVGFKYIYYRDGIEVAQSTSLFTNIVPALPGVYTARLVSPTDPTCFKETPPITVTDITPSLTLSNVNPTCNGGTPNNDGKITITGVTNADRYAFSTGSTFTGGDYASATAVVIPTDIVTGIPNNGATYTVRLFNGGDVCYRDTTIRIFGVSCGLPCGTMAVTASAGICTPSSNFHEVTGEVTFTDVPSSGTLTIAITGGGSVVFNAPFTSPQTFTISDQVSDGNIKDITATFSIDPGCVTTGNYTAPSACNALPCPPNVCVPITAVRRGPRG